jgi:Holliday junction resolvasome RuvABC endonuclease subunit
MVESIYDLLDDKKPDFIIFEDVAYQRNVAALISLSRLQGVLIGYATKHHKDYFIYPASSWRSSLSFEQGKGIKRKALKLQAIDYIKTHFGFQAEEDISESICIGAAFIKNYIEKGQGK